LGNLAFGIAVDWISTRNQLKITEDHSSQSNLKTCSSITNNYVSGSGTNVKTGLYTNISGKISLKTPFYKEPSYKSFDLPINTHNQNITQTNLTFSDIEAPSVLQSIEETPEDFMFYEPPEWIAMSIKISTPCILRVLQLLIQESNPPQYWTLEIFNVTRDLAGLSLYIIPDESTGISISQQVIGTQAAHWYNFTFPNVQLNLSNTYSDAKGFAYYFFKITMPPLTNGSRFLYYSNDYQQTKNQWVFIGRDSYVTSLPLKRAICMRIELAPVNKNPQPSDVQLSIKNWNLPLSNLGIEPNHSVPVHTIDAVTQNMLSGQYQILSQNFNLTDYGTIQNMSFYIKYFGDENIIKIGIFSANTTGIGPFWDANFLFDMTTVINISNGFEGWYTFSMHDLPNLKPGQYWWILLFSASIGSNLTIYGTPDSPDKATALIITLRTYYDIQIIPYNFANIIGIQYGQDFLNVTESWISHNFFISDIFGYHHYTIISRWLGVIWFNVTYCIELENITYIQSNYYSIFQSSEVSWCLSIQATFPTSNLGKILNLTMPVDWNVQNITINGRNHGKNNWTIYEQQDHRIISIHNCFNGKWTIWCNSTVYQIDYAIEKLVRGHFQSALNATVYDRLRVNVTVTNQTNGICYLTVFYPDNKTIFTNQTEISTNHTILSWYPENDSAATGGTYAFVVYWSNGTEYGCNRHYFFFTPVSTNLTLVSSPSPPYVNDITKTLIIRYSDSRGINIYGATISAKLSGISLEWEDIYSRTLNTQDKGFYRIRLNTTGLTANQDYPLIVSARKDGCQNFSLALQQIRVRPVPTSLITNFKNITQYQNQLISFSCSFKDIFHSIGINWASINYTIVGTPIKGIMTNIMPAESVYIANNVKLSNLIGGTYTIKITAVAQNCETISTVIPLHVLNKTGTILTITTPSGIFLQGQSMQIQARLQNESSLLGIPNATIRFSFGGIIPDRIALTDSNGIATIEISIPGVDSFSINATFDEATAIHRASTSSPKINVLTYTNLALWIGVVAAACVLSIVAVRQFYIVPKRKYKIQRYQKIANKFQDIAHLRQLMIFYKESGSCIFQQSFGGELDGDLISGFLTAISSFETELKPKTLLKKESQSDGFEINYKDYKILLFEGTLTRMAYIVEGTPSEEFRKLAQSLIGEYEENYHGYLVEWHGDVAPFKTSGQLIAKRLEISLNWPHKLRKPAPSEKLTNLEESMIKIADTIMKSQATKYFFLPMVISVAQAGAPQSKLDIIAAIYNLRYCDVFNPVDPSSLKT